MKARKKARRRNPEPNIQYDECYQCVNKFVCDFQMQIGKKCYRPIYTNEDGSDHPYPE